MTEPMPAATEPMPAATGPMPAATGPMLAVCIPTHHGRAPFLREALESVLSQLGDVPPGGVTLCISDNASEDNTRAVVAELSAAHPGLISYHRHETNQGFVPNMLQVMERADGVFGWLLSSDDRIAPGGLRRVWDALQSNPDVAGLSVRFQVYDQSMRVSREVLSPRLYPGDRYQKHRYESLEETFAECGSLMGYVSGQVYRRALWADALAVLGRERVLAAGYFPYVLLAGAMLQIQPRWLWLPEPCVENRLDNDSVTQDLERNIVRYQHYVLRDMTAVWAHFLGTRSAAYRKLIGDNLATTWRWRAICSYKTASRCSLRDELLALAEFTRRLYFVPRFWWTTFPVLLIPHGVLRRLAPAVLRLTAVRRRAPTTEVI